METALKLNVPVSMDFNHRKQLGSLEQLWSAPRQPGVGVVSAMCQPRSGSMASVLPEELCASSVVRRRPSLARHGPHTAHRPTLAEQRTAAPKKPANLRSHAVPGKGHGHWADYQTYRSDPKSFVGVSDIRSIVLPHLKNLEVLIFSAAGLAELAELEGVETPGGAAYTDAKWRRFMASIFLFLGFMYVFVAVFVIRIALAKRPQG